MGSMNVYDDGSQSWGSIGSGFASAILNAPAKAAQQQHMIETIKDQRIKRAREEEAYQAANQSADAFAGTLPQQTPAVSVVGPMVGDMSNPVDTAGIPTVEYRDPRLQAQLESNNKLATAAARQLALKGEADKLFPLSATGTVAATGVPDSASERARLQFMTTGRFPTAEERALPAAHNMVIKGPNDEIIDQFSTRNGVTTEDGRRLVDIRAKMTPDQKLLASGAASTEVPNPLKDEGSRLKFLSDYTSKIAGSGYTMTVPEAVRIAQALQAQYGTENKIQSDGYGRIVVFKNFQQREIPGLHGRLAAQVNEVLGQATAPPPPPGQDAAAAAVPPAPVIATAPQPITTEIVSDAATDKADAAAAVALTQVKESRNQLIGLLGADQNGVLPPQPRVPNWLAALANERAGGSVAGNNLVNAADPNALAYFQTAKRVVEPILRLASGAAINKGEYSDYYQMFIPAQGDTPQMMADKLNALRTWQVAVGKSRTASGLLQMVGDLGQGNPVVRATVERMRVKAQQGGRGNTPFTALPAEADAGGADVDAATAIVRGGR